MRSFAKHPTESMLAAACIETPVGFLIPRWTPAGLYSCSLSPKFEMPVVQASDKLRCPLEEVIQNYFACGQLAWDLQQVDWTDVSRFQRVALEGCCQIPPGRTQSYGRLAEIVGSPGAARAVGMAMAGNRWPILIPCHRVVGAGNKLTGYSGAGGLGTKQRLLSLESFHFGNQLQLF